MTMNQIPKALSEMQSDAVVLYGLLEGLVILLNQTPGISGPLGCAVDSLANQAQRCATELASDLDAAL
ncbi:MAG: hypothetical protein ABJQ67_11015 [Marinobacter sp.]